MIWNDKQPIYQQLKDKIVTHILDGSFAEGDAIPSIRQVAEQFQLNHLTVSKSFQMLVDDEILEKHRGLGMFVKTGAKKRLLALERKRFLKTEWPLIKDKINELGLTTGDLFNE